MDSTPSPATRSSSPKAGQQAPQVQLLALPDTQTSATASASPLPTPTATNSRTPTPTLSPTPSPSPSPTPPSGCTGSAPAWPSQVTTNTPYCDGHSTSRIVLANGDTWTAGEVSGVATGSQQGEVQIPQPPAWSSTCAFMAFHSPSPVSTLPRAGADGPMLVSGGRVIERLARKRRLAGQPADPQRGRDRRQRGQCHQGLRRRLQRGQQRIAFHRKLVHDNNCPGVWLCHQSSQQPRMPG